MLRKNLWLVGFAFVIFMLLLFLISCINDVGQLPPPAKANDLNQTPSPTLQSLVKPTAAPPPTPDPQDPVILWLPDHVTVELRMNETYTTTINFISTRPITTATFFLNQSFWLATEYEPSRLENILPNQAYSIELRIRLNKQPDYILGNAIIALQKDEKRLRNWFTLRVTTQLPSPPTYDAQQPHISWQPRSAGSEVIVNRFFYVGAIFTSDQDIANVTIECIITPPSGIELQTIIPDLEYIKAYRPYNFYLDGKVISNSLSHHEIRVYIRDENQRYPDPFYFYLRASLPTPTSTPTFALPLPTLYP